MTPEKVVEALCAYGERFANERVGKKPDFVEAEANPEWSAANDLVIEDSFAFLLAVIYDQGQAAERAWRYPFQLKSRLGHLDPARIAQMRLTDLDEIFGTTRPRLYYWRVASARTLRAAEMVCSRCGGDAKQIWSRGSPTPQELQARFEEFDGIAQKKASMATNILFRDLHQIEIAEDARMGIDVSYDRHVRRVFLRSGLADADNEDAIVEAARRLSQDYPGKLDLPAWLIGRQYCFNASPACAECPISEACARRVRYTVE